MFQSDVLTLRSPTLYFIFLVPLKFTMQPSTSQYYNIYECSWFNFFAQKCVFSTRFISLTLYYSQSMLQIVTHAFILQVFWCDELSWIKRSCSFSMPTMLNCQGPHRRCNYRIYYHICASLVVVRPMHLLRKKQVSHIDFLRWSIIKSSRNRFHLGWLCRAAFWLLTEWPTWQDSGNSTCCMRNGDLIARSCNSVVSRGVLLYSW